VAKLPDGAAKDQVPAMMQTLLADRFKLEIHREQREQPVYELVVGKDGPKLEASPPDDDKAPASADNAAGPSFIFGGPIGGPPGNATATPDGRGGRGGFTIGGTTRITPGANCTLRIEFMKLAMPAFADTLTPFLDRPVVDETGLKGNYRAALELPMEVLLGMAQNMMRTAGMPAPGFGRGGPDGRGGGRGGFAGCAEGIGADASDSSSAAIFQAVQKLGLKLQPHKAPFETIVVDRLEKRPTDN
jgi:uncharacterized protein (TIGR03435 family)